MTAMEIALKAEGYHTFNWDYPSRALPIEELAADLRKQIANQINDGQIHFVTHSMGGILVRQMQQTAPISNIGRVVMLSPPNHGSEVTDKLKNLKPYNWLNGPAGQQLGTALDGFVAQLGPIDFELGVLTGDRSINWILSTMIPGKNDGKVSTASAKIQGMTDYRIHHTTHPMIMKNKKVIADVISFLKTGQFSSKPS